MILFLLQAADYTIPIPETTPLRSGGYSVEFPQQKRKKVSHAYKPMDQATTKNQLYPIPVDENTTDQAAEMPSYTSGFPCSHTGFCFRGSKASRYPDFY